MQSVAVEEKSVLAKQLIELRHRRVTIGQSLGLELVECPLDCSGGTISSRNSFRSSLRFKRNAGFLAPLVDRLMRHRVFPAEPVPIPSFREPEARQMVSPGLG